MRLIKRQGVVTLMDSYVIRINVKDIKSRKGEKMKCLECNNKESIGTSCYCEGCKAKKEKEWSTCRKCGAVDGEDKSNYVHSSLCKKCTDKRESELDFEHAKENDYVTREESIMCPYCGYVEDMDIQEYHNCKSFNCPECEKESSLEIEYTSHFTTSKK